MALFYNDAKEGEFASASGIAGNSVAFTNGALVSKVGGFMVLTANGVKIEGLSNQTTTFASDNQTVAKAKVSYTLTDKNTRVIIAADDILAQTDEGKYFLINTSGQTVDVASASAVASYVNTSDAGSAIDPVVNFQVRLEKFVSQAASVYSIVC